MAREHQEWYQKHLNDLSQDLKERTESDEWLQGELDQYEERMKIHENRQQGQAKRYEEIKRNISTVRHKQSEKRVEAGKHEQRKTMHENKLKERELEVKRCARHFNIRGYDRELDDTEIGEFMDKIAKLSKDQNSKLDRLRQENMKEVQKVQHVIDTLREKRSALQEAKKSAKEQTSVNDRRLALYHSELSKVAIDEGGKAIIESNIEDIKEKLRVARKELSTTDWDTKAQQINFDLRQLEDQNAALNRELIQGTKQAGSLARLEFLQKESKDRQKSLKTMAGAHGDRLKNLIGQQWQPETIQAAYQRVINTRNASVKEAERQRDSANKEFEQLDFKLKVSRTEIKNKEKELGCCAKAILESTAVVPEEYIETLALIQSDRDTRKYDVDAYAILQKWYGDCIESAKGDKPACRLCSRPFQDERSITGFILKLEKHLSTGKLETYQQELKDLELELTKAKGAGSSYDTWLRLSEKELPAIRAEAATLEKQRDVLLRRIEDHDKEVNEREEERRDAETLAGPVANIAKYHGELESINRQTDELSSKQQDSGLSRTLESVQEEIEAVNNKKQSLRSCLEKLQADEKQRRGSVSSLELDLGNAKNKLTTAEHELEKRLKIMSQIDETKKLSQEQRDSLGSCDNELQDLALKFAEQETKRDDLKQRGEKKEKEIMQEATSLSDDARNLQRVDLEIRAYIEEGGPAKLTKCQRDIHDFDQDIIQLETDLKQITVEINKIREELGNHDQNKRGINDNLKYRKTRRELDKVKDEIAKLDTQNAEADQEHHRRQAEKWQRQHNLFSTEETSKMGIMKAKDDQLLQLLKDWDTDYKDAAMKYKKSHIEVEV